MTPSTSPSPSPSGGGPTKILTDLGAPGWLVTAVATLAGLGVLLLALKPLLDAARSGRGVLGRFGLRHREHARAVGRRRLFADHIESQLRRISEKEDVDLPKTIIDLQSSQTAYQAALHASAKIMQTSLLDFLR